MGNALGKDITGKRVRVAGFRRIFQVDEPDGGFGSVPFTSGEAVIGHWIGPNGEHEERARISGWDVREIVD